MKTKIWVIGCLLLVGLSIPLSHTWAAQPEVKYIDPATLKDMMGAPDLVIIDVSKGWWTYDQKIVGSLVYPEDTSTWAPHLSKDKRIVLYCG